MTAPLPSASLTRLLRPLTLIEAHEIRAVALSFLLFFFLLGSYYILRPVRDTLGTVYGAGNLQELYTGTAIATFVAVLVYGEVISRVKLAVFLPWLYGIFILSLAAFFILLESAAHERWVAAAFYIWISAFNLFITSAFWSLMADLFSPAQGKRLFGFISAGGSLGAVVGPGVTALFAERIGVNALILYAAAGFGIAVAILRLLERAKANPSPQQQDHPSARLDRALGGTLLDGFRLLFASRYLLLIAVFVLLVSWVSTIVYFQQAALISQAFASREARARTFATVDIIVNVCALIVQFFGTGRIAQRFGVTATLVVSPVLMVVAFAAVAISPVLMVLLTVQVVRRVSEYAVTKPGREMLFTVVDQESKYKSKNIIDTAVYRLSDVSSAWMTAGVLAVGTGTSGIAAVGIGISLIWGWIGLRLGRLYDRHGKSAITE